MIRSGSHEALGASADRDGVNFALFSEHASAVDLCLFDAAGRETARLRLPARTGDIWHGYLPGCKPGQAYGYRVHGTYDPAAGMRFNPNKLLLDPYAKRLAGSFEWRDEVLGDEPGASDDAPVMSTLDSAPFVPKAVVAGPQPAPRRGVRIPWSETIVYEANVRGFTMRHPDVPQRDRGRFAGMRNGKALEYLKALGITTVELMPVQAFLDEAHLQAMGLRNYWGYNTLAFFAPEPRYGSFEDCREMVDAIHDAGLEVVLDVVYNHTAEGNHLGPTLSFRGIDNAAYYRLMPESSSQYVNDSGCGNTINIDHPRVRRLVRDSLRYWVSEAGVDGFRFDLAPILGRTAAGFDSEHDFFVELDQEPTLSGIKLIAEPWDIGPGGYQLGHFPQRWAEWNDRYRDTVRKFWRGDQGTLGELAHVILGSADRFEHGGRGPWASVGFVASHDGFTLADLVSYEHRHNEANGEENQDGHAHNFSRNYGIEGPTDDPDIAALRRRQRLNMLATVLFSQGTPMLLAGDEIGNSQAGNNNAYAQDNETGWLDWSGLEADPAFLEQVRTMIGLRKDLPLLRQGRHLHGRTRSAAGFRDVEWLEPGGEQLTAEEWDDGNCKTVLLSNTARKQFAPGEPQAVALVLNASEKTTRFTLPELGNDACWRLHFSSSGLDSLGDSLDEATLVGPSFALLVYAGSDARRNEPRA